MLGASSFPCGRLTEDPDDWTPDIRMTVGRVIRYGQGMQHTDCHGVQSLSLHPSSSDQTSHPLHLPGLQMIGTHTVPWAPGHTHLGRLEGELYMVDWIRFVLQREETTLRQVGIYEAVFLSLFEYRLDISFFQSLVDRWSYISNTAILEDRELTISPMEFHRLSGLPVFGDPYDEYLPRGEDLTRDLPGGSHHYSISLRRVLGIYSTLSSSGGVTFSVWIRHFTDRVQRPCHQFACPSDPFGTGEAEVSHSGVIPNLRSISLQTLDRETYLTAFLAWWLCYFVVPGQPLGMIRPDTFVMASMLARGQMISLAIPALANVFRCLRILSTSSDPSYCDEVIPFHFLGGWAHLYWPGLYAPAMDHHMRRHLPLLAEIAGAVSSPLPAWLARQYFRSSIRHLRPLEGRVFPSHTPRDSDLDMIDESPREDCPRGLVPGSTEAEFFVSIMHGFSPLRLGDRVILEPYMPHRCAHQFGLDQDVPVMIRTADSVVADLDGAVRCWTAFLRLDTRCRFTIPSTSRVGIFSAFYEKWFHAMLRPCILHPLDHWLSMVCPASSDPVRRRQVPSLEMASDLQSRDSYFAFPRVDSSTFVRAGTFFMFLFYGLYIPLFVSFDISFLNFQEVLLLPRRRHRFHMGYPTMFIRLHILMFTCLRRR